MSNTVEEIPEWIVKYDKANHQSSAGKAIRYLMERLKVVSTPQVVSEEDIERMAEAIMNSNNLYPITMREVALRDGKPGTMYDRTLKAMVEMYKAALLKKQNDEPSKGNTDFEPVASLSSGFSNSNHQK